MAPPDSLRKANGILLIAVSTVMVLMIGLLDALTGAEIAFAIFYLVPLALVSWYGGRTPGIMIALLSAGTWYVADFFSGIVYTRPLITLWNTFSSFVFFVSFSIVLARLKILLDQEKLLARTDPLTGAANARAFSEKAASTIGIAARYRHPFTVVYMDVDNFKTVNDTLGHSAGDEMLRTVVVTIREHIRSTDIVARVGGDEFVILFPETGQDAADAAIKKLRNGLTAMVRKNNWPVTFSIGAVTLTGGVHPVDDVLRMADTLMYAVKNGTKNGVRHETITMEQVHASREG